MMILKKAVVLFAFLLLLPCVNASITLSEPKDVYNLGDKLDIDLTILDNSRDIQGFVSILLNCGNSSTLLSYAPTGSEPVKAGKEFELEYSTLLSKEYVNSQITLGSCYTEAVLKDMGMKQIDSAISKVFTITDKIDLSILLNREEILPGENLKISGIALLKNGKEVDGTAKINFGKDYTAEIINSKFDLTLALNKDIKSGNHKIDLYVSDDAGNSGQESKEISIIPVLTSINLQINKDKFLPERELIMKTIFYDQANDEMEAEGTLKLISPKGEEVLNNLVMLNSEEEYTFERDAYPGMWKARVVSGDVEAEKLIEMQEKEQIDVELKKEPGMTYFDITNIGNIPYLKEMTVQFTGDELIETTKRISLDVGESVSFKMTAPSGDYEVVINSGNFEKSLGVVSLTGEAIDVIDIVQSERKALVRNVVIILFLASFMFIFGQKFFREWNYRRRVAKSKKENEQSRKYIVKVKSNSLLPEDVQNALGMSDEAKWGK